MSLENTNLHGYLISRKLGEGGMATVYEAIENEKLGTKVGIKVLHAELLRNSNIRQRFENEAKIMASLRHPNIVQVRDFIEQDEVLAIVMEYLEGGSLSDLLRNKTKFTKENFINMFSQILSAFEYAHSKGVIHRDIKPSNIFVDNLGNVKVLDFGIAKLFESDGGTTTGGMLGTPQYMSPEQIVNPKEIDHRTDIYSLGITLYALLTGESPFGSTEDSYFTIQNRIVNESLTGMEKIPEPFKSIVLKATAKNPGYRYQNAAEFKSALLGQSAPAINKPFVEEKTQIHSSTNNSVQHDKGFVEERTMLQNKPIEKPSEKVNSNQQSKQPIPLNTNINTNSDYRLNKLYKIYKSRNVFYFIMIGVIAAMGVISFGFVGRDFILWYSISVFLISVTALLYQISYLRGIWHTTKFLEEKGIKEVSANQAVGNLFIPLYNFYWLFRINSYLAQNMNKLNGKEVVNTGSTTLYSVGQILPFINMITLFVFSRRFMAKVSQASCMAEKSPLQTKFKGGISVLLPALFFPIAAIGFGSGLFFLLTKYQHYIYEQYEMDTNTTDSSSVQPEYDSTLDSAAAQ